MTAEVDYVLDRLADVAADQPEAEPHQRFDETKTEVLSPDESLELVIPEGAEREALALIDDGSTGGTPAAYDLETQLWNPDLGEYQTLALAEGLQARSIEDQLWEDRFRYRLTNRSGSQATYRLHVIATAQGADGAHPLHRVDRDASRIIESAKSVDMASPVETRRGELRSANLVGASFVDEEKTPIGTKYDHEVERVVGVRVEGFSGDFGHIDPDAENGVPFDDLVDQIQRQLLADRTYPEVGRRRTDYTHLELTNDAPQSADYGDYHRHDFDVVFRGFESLP